jgi:2-succinyl-6-hydroxy-2,4-cyclohexadiene-1-carboxylate synthase
MSVASVGDLLAEALPEWVGAAPGKPVKADWLGYSMGARIALTLATSRPGVVSRLILESGTPGLAREGERRARREADEGLVQSLEREGMAPFVERWLALPLFAGIRALPPEEFQEEERRRLANRPPALAGVLRRLGTGTQPDLRGALPALDSPTLLLAGGDDPKFALLAREMEGLIPGARRVEWPGVGHVPHRELSPELWLGVVEGFLAPPVEGQPPPISSRKASP